MPGQYFDVYGMIEVDEPPRPETVRSDFFRLVGESIKEWAKVEEQLFELVLFAMQCPRKQAAIVFYRTQTIGRRFELADQLLRACLSAEDISRWKCMTKNIDPLKAVRNLLAHAPMRHHHKLSVGAQRVAAASSWIEVAISADEELVRAKKLTVRDTDLPGHLEEVRRLAADLQSFMGSLRK